jgi:urea carboxylase
MSTTVQDYPGRAKLWAVGVPPSGAMDALSLRYANALVGNDDSAAALEVTLRGPSLRFHRAATVAVCGGEFTVSLADGRGGAVHPQATWAAFEAPAGAVLTVGVATRGSRCYIAVDGGFDAPMYLGSRSTFPGGNLGGYQGRILQV